MAPYLLLAAVLLFFALIRFRLRDMPLERDEGEYAYAGQLILEGIPPYKLVYNMKLPGTYVAYAVIMALFGETTAAIHLGLLLVSAATTVLVFFLARRRFDRTTAVVAAATYALLVTSSSVLGFAAHATNFVILPVMGGTLLLLEAISYQQTSLFLWSGVLFGLAFVMKQPGGLFIAFAITYLIATQWKSQADWRDFAKRLAIFWCGAALPFALTCLWLWKAGVFHRFWFWTFTYARFYATILSWSEARVLFRPRAWFVIGPAVRIWIAAAIGLVILFWKRRSFDTFFFEIAFLLCSCLAVCPGLYFRAHYFILLLPAISLLVGAAVGLTTQEFRDRPRLRPFRFVPALIFLSVFVHTIRHQRYFFFGVDPDTASGLAYGTTLFPAAVDIGDYLQSRVPPSASIAVLGSEPEIYFYSRRHSATGYIYAYPLMENQPFALAMQKEMISDIENARPGFLVYIDVPSSWDRTAASPSLIFDWSQKYVAENYGLAKVVDVQRVVHYVTGRHVWTGTVSHYTVRILKRNSS